MTVKKGYNRFFIIFQEEDRGFGIAIDKQPTGYTKIESRNGKCKITVYVQNLIKEKGPYVCCLLDTTKNPVVFAKMGEITVDETGRGETWWEYREEDIAETGIPADRFNTAAVVIEGAEVLSPLAGYVGKDRQSWKDRLPLNNKRTAVIVEKPETESEELEEEGRKFKEYEEKLKEQETSIKEKIDVKPEPVKVTEIETEMEMKSSEPDVQIIEEQTEIENVDIIEEPDAGLLVQEDETQIIEGNMEFSRISDDDMFEDDEDRDKKKKSHAAMFIEILKNYEEIKEISPEFKGCRWWKVPHDDDLQIKDNEYHPYYCAIHHLKMTYPYLNYIKYFKKLGYFYFGIKFDKSGEVKYFMYGIQGDKNHQEQPYMGMTGFAKWVPVAGKNTGMWIMYYNPYTGCIMIPKKEHKMKEDYE